MLEMPPTAMVQGTDVSDPSPPWSLDAAGSTDRSTVGAAVAVGASAGAGGTVVVGAGSGFGGADTGGLAILGGGGGWPSNGAEPWPVGGRTMVWPGWVRLGWVGARSRPRFAVVTADRW